MALEIERKFLLSDDSWKKNVRYSFKLQQGYLSTEPERTVRIRIRAGIAVLTVKGLVTGYTRPEFEYEIPLADGKEMLALCTSRITKSRSIVHANDFVFEIDTFHTENKGLVVAEIEFDEDDTRADLPEDELRLLLPEWVGEEVSDDVRYYNSSLIKHPYNKW